MRSVLIAFFLLIVLGLFSGGAQRRLRAWFRGRAARVFAVPCGLAALLVLVLPGGPALAALATAYTLAPTWLVWCNQSLGRDLAAYAGERSRFVPAAAAILFSLAGGYASARVYLRFRSLYALAIAHGLIAVSLYLTAPDSITAHFVIGPRYLLDVYGIFPEFLL